MELLRQIFGKVIDIMISKAPKLRGRAIVMYKETGDTFSTIKRLQVRKLFSLFVINHHIIIGISILRKTATITQTYYRTQCKTDEK